MITIDAWLTELGQEKYIPVFRELEVDMDVVTDLNDSELEKIGIPLGPRKKLLRAIAGLNADDSPLGAPGSIEMAPERRHLTVMFCDVVGSTALAEQFDPEDLSVILTHFRNHCQAVVDRYAGHTARYHGDGMLVYFGYPFAHEDDTERAIRAGLDIIREVSSASVLGVTLQVRIGIATGGVVVGEIIGRGGAREHAIFGETPNLASRLQSQARPDTLVISDQTWQLAGALFECTDLGRTSLKGFSGETQLWQPTALKSIESRFDATRAGHGALTLIGRESELETLKHCWRLTRQGHGQLVSISGEPGMGKSRLIHELRNLSDGEPHTLLRYYCSPYHQSSALHPVTAQLERAAGFQIDDTPHSRIEKLQKRLSAILGEREAAKSVELFASILSIPVTEGASTTNLAPAVQREKTIQGLVQHLEMLSQRQPVMVIFEDLHWIDPTSLDVLTRTIQRIDQHRVFLLVTHRPEFEPAWRDASNLTAITLKRLKRDCTLRLIDSITEGKALPEGLVNSIVNKSDGTPLFIEELTKTVLSSDYLTESDQCYELNRPLPPLAVPDTLKDSLMARLNQAPVVRETAQIGAVIGRSFNFDLLSRLSPLEQTPLLRALAELEAGDLISSHGAGPDSSYTFKHALVQDAAYDSLLHSAKKDLHLRIARILESQFQALVENEPELLAHHYAGANQPEKSVDHWLKAGHRAMRRSNYLESVSHCRHGLALLDTCQPSIERHQKELQIRAVLGVGLVATMGYAAEEVSVNYARAGNVCDQIGDTPSLIPALYGQWVYHLLRGNRDSAFALAEQLFTYRNRESSSLVTLSALAITTFYSGNRISANNLLHDAIRRFVPGRHTETAVLFGDDADMLPSFYSYWNQWLSGYPEKALTELETADRQVTTLGTPYVVATGMLFHMILKHALGDIEGVVDAAARFEKHSTEQGYPFFVALANIGSAWSRIQTTGDVENIDAIKQAIAGFRMTGARLPVSYWMHYLVQAQLQCGDLEGGLESVDEALQLTGELLDDFYLPELLRLKGDLLLARHGESDAVEQLYQKALITAQQMQAKMFELRISVSLARLQLSKNQLKEAYLSLSSCVEWFTEGFETPDLLQARQLLDTIVSQLKSQREVAEPPGDWDVAVNQDLP